METSHIDGSLAFQMHVAAASRQEHLIKQRSPNYTQEHLLLGEAEARELRFSRIATFGEKCWRAVESRDVGASVLSSAEHSMLRKVIGKGNTRKRPISRDISCLASNPYARGLLFDEVYECLKAVHAQPHVSMYFATIVHRDWLLPNSSKSFDLKMMRQQLEDTLAAIGWHSILFFEVQTITNMKDIKYLPHLHGFLWREKRAGFKVTEAKDFLNSRFRGLATAKGCTLSKIPKGAPLGLTTRFFYATKLPDTGKAFAPVEGSDHAFNTEVPGKLKTAHSQNYTDLDALRIVRLLAQHEVDDTVMAVGDGAKIREAASAKLTAMVEERRLLLPDPTPERVRTTLSKLLRD